MSARTMASLAGEPKRISSEGITTIAKAFLPVRRMEPVLNWLTLPVVFSPSQPPVVAPPSAAGT
jgi:hypothetical protein